MSLSLFTSILLAFFAISRAEDDSDDNDAVVESDSLDESGDDVEEDAQMRDLITTNTFFPNHPDRKMQLGTPIDSVITFSCPDRVFVLGAHTTIASPFNSSKVLETVSPDYFNQSIPAGEHHSLWYQWTAPAHLEARKYNVTINLVYRNSHNNNTDMIPVFSGDLDLTPPPSSFTLVTAFTWLFLLLLIGATVYGVRVMTSKNPHKAINILTRSEPSRPRRERDDDFIPQAHKAFLKSSTSPRKAGDSTSPRKQSESSPRRPGSATSPAK